MRFTEPAMRPPQEARSLLPRATQGCSYNKCFFCYVSRGYKFLAVTPEEMDEEVQSLAPFYPDTTRIYLTGSNPFVLPVARLTDYIAVLRKHVPHFSALSMQSRIGDIAMKSDAELLQLRSLGLSELYIGTENGNDRALILMNKGHTQAEAIAQLKRLDAAGIRYTTFYVLGLGGKGMGRESGLATAAMFNQVHPIRITTTGMTIFPNTPLAAMVAEGRYIETSEREKIEELLVFLEHLTVDTFYDGIHYLNPLNYRFAICHEAEKKRVLADIRDVLANMSDAELEQMVSRSHMHSL